MVVFCHRDSRFLVHGVHGATATTDFPGASDSLKILQASLAAKRSHELLMSKQLRASTERRYLVVGYLGNTCPKREPEKNIIHTWYYYALSETLISWSCMSYIHIPSCNYYRLWRFAGLRASVLQEKSKDYICCASQTDICVCKSYIYM